MAPASIVRKPGPRASEGVNFSLTDGIEHRPQNGEDYLRALIALAKDTAGA
jgi:hypothetical protein